MTLIERIASGLQSAAKRRRLLYFLIYQQLEQRYHGSLIGLLWTLVGPALTFATFVVVFAVINRWDFQDFGLYFLSGYVFWNFFSTAVLLASDSIVGNAIFVTRVRIPTILLPVSTLGVSLIDLLAGLVILGALMSWKGISLSAHLLFLIVSVGCSIFFAAGIGLLCAVFTVFFRDFRHLLSSFMFLWFFFSPILWRPDRISPELRHLISWNPVAPFLVLFQDPAWRGAVPPDDVVIRAFSFALASVVLGLVVFFSHERKFYYHL